VRREAGTGACSPAPASHASPLTPPPQIGIVAGEASGDLLGSLLIKAVQDAGISSAFQGIAGQKMQARGAVSLFPMETLAVRGYVEALANLRAILGIRRSLRSRFLSRPPRLFVGVDAPDFNLALEADLRRAGIPTVHFVSPSIWAWRRKRIRKIRRAVSHMLLIFPFEESIYREAGIPATYVGHPLAYALPQVPDRTRARMRLNLERDAEYVALLPGSRQSEMKHLATLFLQAAKELSGRRPNVRFLVPVVSLETRVLFEQAVYRAQAHDLPLRLLFGHAHDALEAADCALIASGTATLEALLLGCPHVISYRVPWLTYQIMKRQAYLPWVGLPNILAARGIVPELLQDQATPEALADALEGLLADAARREGMSRAFADIRSALQRDTPRLIADALRPFLT